jgi:5-methylcytosine-specific restriction endonuclease McrA
MVLLYRDKVEMLENGSGFIHTASQTYPLPSVIRLGYMVKRPRLKRKLSRIDVFVRDRSTCQYCGKETKQLTLDHIVPKSQGGKHTWENVVSACMRCNHHKAGKTPEQAGMRLIQQPFPPRGKTSFIPNYYHKIRTEWEKYLN